VATLPFEKPKGLLFDLDGVLFVGDQPIEGARETIAWIKSKGIPTRFLTNTTTRSLAKLHEKLKRLDLPIELDEVFSPPRIAAAWLRQKGSPTVLLVLNDDTRTEFDSFEENPAQPDYIVLGDYGNEWDYKLLNRLFNLLLQGSEMLALHKGKMWQTENGMRMDIGAFVTGLEYTSGKQATVIGKPEKPFFELAIASMNLRPSEIIMIGDDIYNDIRGAKNVGARAILVRTGKYREELVNSAEVKPDLVIDSVVDLKGLL